MNKVMQVYRLLSDHFGPTDWWPAESKFEMMIGALLMSQTSWRNVERAIRNLKERGMLSPAGIAKTRLETLTRLVRPAGLYRSKPRRLREFSRHILNETGGDVDAFLRRDPRMLREELLSMEGVGAETADSILLYAAGARVFVVDAYTRRIAKRVGLFILDDYARVQAFFQKNVSGGVEVYREYHALVVLLAKEICRPRPRCDVCPLAGICDYARATKARLQPPKMRKRRSRV